ncbi:glycerol-3-phosphate dehydrogenase [Brevundimonas sp. LM2]|uniref:NAD(P)H-dependent glycerol-3-phosphate dehydrogenase n=1 Tax=Brevundimonas sp. LM2 TaxID=1938605 RepID=UPI000983E8ED|nr:NAD(P)H-dependent glycerol-3-phosphate dehydrogenase [Brevundimonas sp. LM2]AQR60500.1 glycerol-3-phosphate dehydrogenase [Brevundimonas sp. LM2]
MQFRTAGVIGAGAWGTALALVCARAGLNVILQAREPEVVESITARRINEAFLPGVVLDAAISVTADLADLGACDLVLAVPPAQFMRGTLAAYAPHHRDGAPIVLCSKGIERGSLKLMTEVLAETIPDAPAAVLSGPSFAADVSKGLPTAVTLACADAGLGERLMETLSGPGFRPYLATDLIGAEVGGAIKNVLAIACGISEGRGLGRSAHAALITRGFAEMTRMGVALGGEPETVAGLCGLGDLVLTCSSPQSRNMSLGLALGQGQTIDQALAGKRSVAEGYESAPAVRDLARKMGVEMPICAATAALLAGETTVEAMIESLLSRPLKAERA